MDVGDHKRGEHIHFHTLGLWGSDIVDHHGWALKKLSSLKQQLGHTDVPCHEILTLH